METIIFSVFNVILAHNLNKKLLIENLALRQQLMVMKLAVKRPKIRKRDHLFWVILSWLWKGWKGPLVVVLPSFLDNSVAKFSSDENFAKDWRMKLQTPAILVKIVFIYMDKSIHQFYFLVPRVALGLKQ